MKRNKVTMKEGTISFWIRAEEVNFTPGERVNFGSAFIEGGSIEVYKDKDENLKVLFSVKGVGQKELTFDMSSINQDKRHMVALTWNKDEDEIILYFDGEKRDETNFPG